MTKANLSHLPEDTEVVTLCGGHGSRISDTFTNIPKGLIPFNGVPFLDFAIQFFTNQGIKKIILSEEFLGSVIIERYSQFSEPEIIISNEKLIDIEIPERLGQFKNYLNKYNLKINTVKLHP